VMNSTEMTGEIREANLTYLMLAQQMLRDDRDSAMYRLGIGDDVAEIMEVLTPAQIAKMASSSVLLCRFRCDDRAVFELMAGHGRIPATNNSHAAILMTSKPAVRMN
jgi:flagellar transcriptional activator FlhD